MNHDGTTTDNLKKASEQWLTVLRDLNAILLMLYSHSEAQIIIYAIGLSAMNSDGDLVQVAIPCTDCHVITPLVFLVVYDNVGCTELHGCLAKECKDIL